MNTKVYKLLAVLFDSSGNFNQARQNMNDRGQKAMYNKFTTSLAPPEHVL